ncbi:MAG: ATP-grasp domain-containing protein [Kineosporiaceae bacterium]|nr:ATP-grasp domain-containing protein [Kineosporiaceae bacterium]
MRQLRRVAIVNRGEAAMRLIHAVRELSARTGEPIETIALHTDGERTAMFVREADHAYSLGPAAARPYLDHAVLERALRESGADAAWVGWGFVAEDPAFAELCERIGVTFVGPGPEAMRDLGDKIASKLIAEKAGVPVATWSDGPVPDVDAAVEHAARIGYPMMLKAAAGGGGRGIRVVRSDEDLRAVFDRTREEALRAFGSDVVFLERLMTGARHVEVQLIADGQGTAWALGVRDCSVQRRNQKVIEESSSVVLDAEQVRLLKESAARLALSVGYRGAGTAEFLYQPAEHSFAFLEVNTRLQVEHPVTEMTTGLDLVALQLGVAAGARLSDLVGEQPAESGHAVEARLNAEDPDRDFAPAPGRIALLRLPTGPGLRIDTGVGEGDVIPADFDSMIAKVIAYGANREQALARLRRALEDTTVVIEGGTTNKSFILDLLSRPEVREGRADTGWIDRERAGGGLTNHRHAGIALVAAGIDAYDEVQRAERNRFLASAWGGRPQARHEPGREFSLGLRGSTHELAVAQVGLDRYRVSVDGAVVEAELERLGPFSGRLVVEGEAHKVVMATHAAAHQVEVDAAVHRITKDSGGVLPSPAPALVVALPVAAGDLVAAGAPVIVLESMKMETVIPAPYPARVRELLVGEGDQVGAGDPLLALEPVEEEGGENPGSGAAAETVVDLPVAAVEPTPAEHALGALADLRHLLLGFDIAPEQGRLLVGEYRSLCEESGWGGTHSADEPTAARLLDAELDVLTVFADLCELGRNRPHAGLAGEDDEDGRGERVHSPREYFHTYLHSLDADRAGLPEAFRAKLIRMLGHYGITSLERTPRLEEAVHRVFLAQQLTPSLVTAIAELLERWLASPVPARGQATHATDVLDRLVHATQLRYPTVGDLARSARHRWFEAPLTEAARTAAYDEVQAHLAYLAAHPGARDHDQRVDALVASPEPLVRFLADRLGSSGAPVEPMLEVLVRRHYRDHTLHRLDVRAPGDRALVTADYVIDQRPSHLVATVADLGELERGSALIDLLTAEVEAAPVGHETVIDLYLFWPDQPDGEAAVERLGDLVNRLPVVRRVRRLTVVSCSAADAVRHITFRPQRFHADAGGHFHADAGVEDSPGEEMVEDTLVRGVHPMVGRRLNLWRLRDFALTRLDSPSDVLLYRAVAPGNEADVRLVAIAQVRELSIVRDSEGTVHSLPQAERALATCMDAVRRARAAEQERLGRRITLDMNHIWLYIWPVIDAELEQLTALRRSIAPLTVGAGVEEVVAWGHVGLGAGEPTAIAARFSYQPGTGVEASVGPPPRTRVEPLDDYAQKVLRSRRRGAIYPYELIQLLIEDGGSFVEHDLLGGELVAVRRDPGTNTAGVVVGVVTTPTARHPEGVRRVVLIGDPTRSLGSVAEAECRRIIAALDRAERERIPVEWFALSAGARISMTSGTENMDWVARALRRIIEFTQGGGEINIVVTGITVGAQPYWNAEATMLMHTKGILVMTPDSAMVLTGKASLDYSGGVSAEDNFGIGGYDRVMGPNGQAQYWAVDLAGAIEILNAHYDHSYVAPGERAARAVATTDPRERDVCDYPHPAVDGAAPDFRTVGDIFSAAANPERKKPFDIRTVMHAVADADHRPLERWADMADAETCVVMDAHLGGYPVCLLGIESRAIGRRGFPPTDGPDAWTAGTLFPRSSTKAARAINAASGSRPVVMLANLSGFDGSPESMRRLQLEYGAEIGRAVTNFDGAIVFCVISRYHGGAFVVFSKALNDRMQVLAVEGSYASVIGGAPAAGVVFAGEVDARTSADPRVRALERYLASAGEAEAALQRRELAELRAAVRAEKLREVAAEFDAVHSIERAVEVGSVDAIIPASRLRPELIAAVERGRA